MELGADRPCELCVVKCSQERREEGGKEWEKKDIRIKDHINNLHLDKLTFE